MSVPAPQLVSACCFNHATSDIRFWRSDGKWQRYVSNLFSVVSRKVDIGRNGGSFLLIFTFGYRFAFLLLL